MKSTFLAVRAIGAEFARQIYVAAAIIVGVLSLGSLGLSLWLTTFNAWWWVLFAALAIWILIAVVGLVAVKLIITALAPTLAKEQKVATKAFVGKLQRLSEVAGTPKPILLFQIMRDMVSPRQNGLITSVSSDTSSLKRDFIALVKSFE